MPPFFGYLNRMSMKLPSYNRILIFLLHWYNLNILNLWKISLNLEIAIKPAKMRSKCVVSKSD